MRYNYAYGRNVRTLVTASRRGADGVVMSDELRYEIKLADYENLLDENSSMRQILDVIATIMGEYKKTRDEGI